MNEYFYIHPLWNTRKATIIFDRAKDNDATIKNKILTAVRNFKIDYNIKNLQKDIQKCKKHKSITIWS